MAAVTAGPILGPEAWRGADLARTADWIRTIEPAELDELDAALRAVERRGLRWRDITRADFPLSRFARTLDAVSRELEHGRGFGEREDILRLFAEEVMARL